jgi:hypothetical protein
MILRAQIGFPVDTALPRDVMTINPHFNGTNAAALADQLATNLKAITEVGTTRSFTIKVYDAQASPPNYPLATVVNGTGFSTASRPREIAVCLSYYGVNNRPRERGRLYIPGLFVPGAFDLRPSSTQRVAIGNWATAFQTGLQSIGVWVVYSRIQGSAISVKNWFVDDEWDIVRSRGTRPTTRLTGVVP